MAKNNTVSIIVPTYNSARTIDVCLASIAEQSYKSIELIVVDNHSTDATAQIARKYTKHVYTKGPERNAQRNYGLKKATGVYVLIIDSDMKLSKHVVKECVEQMTRNESLAGLYIPEESFGEGFWAQCIKLERSFYVGKDWIEAARFFKKSTLDKIGGFDESLVSAEDWYLTQQVEKFGPIGRIETYIYHDEGSPTLWKRISKKYYYATKIQAFFDKSSNKNESLSQGGNVLRRYMLFFSQPGKLFRNPIIGCGMLLLKTLEYLMGLCGLIRSKITL